MSASAILKLQAAGFSVEQVTALAELIDSQASSKSDILEVEHRLEVRISGVEAKIAESKIDTIKWMIGLLLAQTGLLLGGLKLFLH